MPERVDTLDLLLLEAALGQDRERALNCWQSWRAQTSLDDCEYRLHQLLPLLFRGFEGGGIEAADLNILRGVYRYYWSKNQLRLGSATSTIQALQEAGVEVLVLGGLALAYRYFPDPGTCPQQQFDLLIRPQQRTLALEVLQRHGWKLDAWPGDPCIVDRCPLQHSDGQGLTLRWHACQDCRWSGADDGFWLRSQPVAIHRLSARTLCPADMLLHTCLQPGRDPVEWWMNAAVLLRQPIDWALFQKEVRDRRVPLEKLTTLPSIPEVTIPVGLLSTTLNWMDRRYFDGKPAWLLPYLDYRRCRRSEGFLQYLRRRWGLPRLRSIPFYLLRLTLGRLFSTAP